MFHVLVTRKTHRRRSQNIRQDPLVIRLRGKPSAVHSFRLFPTPATTSAGVRSSSRSRYGNFTCPSGCLESLEEHAQARLAPFRIRGRESTLCRIAVVEVEIGGRGRGDELGERRAGLRYRRGYVKFSYVEYLLIHCTLHAHDKQVKPKSLNLRDNHLSI